MDFGPEELSAPPETPDTQKFWSRELRVTSNRQFNAALASRRLPRQIWILGFVSLLMDISSEMIHALLPVFLVVTLGASTEMVGLIEGLGEGTASVTKVFSGWLSDRLGRRKALAVAGYAMSTMTKPIFALAPTASWVLGARFADRIGKGLRGAPRDALVADLAPPWYERRRLRTSPVS